MWPEEIPINGDQSRPSVFLIRTYQYLQIFLIEYKGRYPGKGDDDKSLLPAVMDEMCHADGLPAPLQPVQHVSKEPKKN